jgi:hypothetical protein
MTGLSLSSPEPDVSVVFETENDEPNHRIRLTDVMKAWLRQSAVARVAEWIASPRPATPEGGAAGGGARAVDERPDRYWPEERRKPRGFAAIHRAAD